ncbi:MAG: DUF3786 domain-containing protein [Chloroflexota bacterium]
MFVGESQDWLEGEEQAWNTLTRLAPQQVCCRAKVHFDIANQRYMLPVFNDTHFVSLKEKDFWGRSNTADLILNRFPHYYRLSALWYLIQAKDIPLSGTFINPREVSGGFIFEQGTHMLPLQELAARYGRDPDGLLQKGRAFGGERLEYADLSVRLFPFPRLPVTLLLWQEDDEFPARADVLLDETCSSHLSTDIIWSTVMLTVLLMLN